MLLNRMGPIGQEIHRTFHFYGEDKNTLDINILIKKFDLYCLYGGKKRGNKDIDEYIYELKVCPSENRQQNQFDVDSMSI